MKKTTEVGVLQDERAVDNVGCALDHLDEFVIALDLAIDEGGYSAHDRRVLNSIRIEAGKLMAKIYAACGEPTTAEEVLEQRSPKPRARRV